MDPCSYARVLIGNLTLSIPVASRTVSGVHPSSSPCFCVIRFNHQKFACPVTVTSNSTDQIKQDVAATFYLTKADIDHLLMKKSPPKVKISIFKGRRGAVCCVSARRLLGKVKVDMSDLVKAEERSIVFVNGFVGLVGGRKEDGKLHLNVRSELDPRYVFEFDGEPECSPQIAAVNGHFRQPAFSCKFRSSTRSLESRSLSLETPPPSSSRILHKERKRWCITIHDLTGSTVAMASMQTPFVASPGTDRVSRSNSGSWIIFRGNGGSHKVLKPWGRLEAWRQRGGSHDRLGYKFELLPDLTRNANGVDVCLAESSIDLGKGGSFVIDLTWNENLGRNLSPGCSQRGSPDFGFGPYSLMGCRGFVMRSSVGGEGRCSKPSVEVVVQHVGCMEDAAAYVALAAAVDLSVDACALFSRRLRKELRPQSREAF